MCDFNRDLVKAVAQVCDVLNSPLAEMLDLETKVDIVDTASHALEETRRQLIQSKPVEVAP